MNLSREFSLEAKTVEKDYVLGWLLAGIASHSLLLKNGFSKVEHALKNAILRPIVFRKIWTIPS